MAVAMVVAMAAITGEDERCYRLLEPGTGYSDPDEGFSISYGIDLSTL